MSERLRLETGALFAAVCPDGARGHGGEAAHELLRAERARVVKVKNPSYWRRDLEREAMRRSRERKPCIGVEER
jgi:hypothetical protein